jgi:hypothetical protein
VFAKGEVTQPQGMTMQVRNPGIFQIGGLAPGDYTLVARSMAVAPVPVQQSESSTGPAITVRATDPPVSSLSGRVDVSLGNTNLENLTIRLTEGAEISGRFIVEGMDLPTFKATLPAIGARPVAVSTGVISTGVATALPPVQQSLSLGIGLVSQEGPSAQMVGTVSDDGTFRISKIPPVKRFVEVSPLPANAYVKSIRFGGQDVTRAPLDLSTGVGGLLEIVISTKGAEISPVPSNDKGETPQGSAPVTIWPRTPNPGSASGDVRLFSITGAGSKAQGLAPGEYYVAAWETSADFLRVPEFLARFTALATKVTVAEGESVTVEPKTISRDALEKEIAQFP